MPCRSRSAMVVHLLPSSVAIGPTTVGSGKSLATYRAKSYVFRQGTKCNAVFYIQQGHIELSVVSSQGKERVLQRDEETHRPPRGQLALRSTSAKDPRLRHDECQRPQDEGADVNGLEEEVDQAGA